MPATVEDLIDLFTLAEVGTGKFRGPQPNTTWQRLFGGQVMAQTLVAAMRTVAPSRQLHSLHGYFLRPGSKEESLRFEVEHVRDGRTFSARRVTTRQHDDVIFDLNASFQEPEKGLSHGAAQPDGVPGPKSCPQLGEVLEKRFGAPVRMLAEWDALDVRLAGAPTPTPDGGVMRAWVRTQGELPDEPWLHTAILAYLTDVLLLSVSTVQHEVEFLSPAMQAASIDHAMWFHRPVRCDRWLLYDMVSPSASGARGYCQGRLFQDGQLVASCAQEGLIRIVEE
ncbi:MAG: acyl-CoA thioesterase II [Propionibacteriaceae bacterium]|nr:acyl-CoA thioesterase II [Propionibacteriaceae bacterium]